MRDAVHNYEAVSSIIWATFWGWFLFVLLADTTANVCPVLSTSCQSNFLKRFSPRSSSIILGSKNLWDGESRNFMLEAEIDHFSAKQSLSRFHLSRGNGPGLVTTNRMYYTISCSNICLRWGLCGRCVVAQLRLNGSVIPRAARIALISHM